MNFALVDSVFIHSLIHLLILYIYIFFLRHITALSGKFYAVFLRIKCFIPLVFFNIQLLQTGEKIARNIRAVRRLKLRIKSVLFLAFYLLFVGRFFLLSLGNEKNKVENRRF